VTTEARNAIEVLAPGGEFILGPGCALGSDTPDTNVDALIEAAHRYGVYARMAPWCRKPDVPTPRRKGSIAGRGWDVLGIGAVAVDDLLYVDAYPGPDTKVRIRSEQREGGGLVATALVTVARLGGSSAFLAVLGRDELSVFAIGELERAGVDGSRIIRRAGARPVHSRIIVDGHTGQRTILYSMTGVVAPRPMRSSRQMSRPAASCSSTARSCRRPVMRPGWPGDPASRWSRTSNTLTNPVSTS